MEDYKINISGAYGSSDNDIKRIYLKAVDAGKIDSVYVEYNDGYIEIEDKPENIDYTEFALAINKFMNSLGFTGKEGKGSKWFIAKQENSLINFNELDERYDELHNNAQDEELDLSVDGEEEDLVATPYVDETELPEQVRIVEDEFNNNQKYTPERKNNFLKDVMIGVGAGLLTSALVVGGYELWQEYKEGKEAQEAENPDEVVELPGMTVEEETAVNEAAEFQTSTFDSLENGIKEVNEYTKKFYHSPITDDEIKSLKEMGLTIDEDRNYANFAFNTEEVYAANIRYTDYSKEDLAKLNHGELIDINKVMNSAESLSNNFEQDMAMLIAMDEEYDFNIKSLFPNITDKQAEEFNQFLPMFKEYKKLLKEENFKDAEKKMQDIRHDIAEYAYGENQDTDSFKAFTLKTFGTAGSLLSVMNQYKQDITYAAFNVNTGKEEQVKVKNAPLFDEKFTRDLFLGWDGCDEVQIGGESYSSVSLSIYGLNKNYVIIEDYEDAIVDRFLGNETGRLEDYNNWISQLRNENALMDSNENSSEEFRATNSEFDSLVNGTYAPSALLASIKDTMESESLDPVNMEYYNLYFAQKVIEFKNKNVKTSQGKPGDVIVTGTFTAQPVTAVDLTTGVMRDGGSVQEAAKQAKKDWEKKQKDGHDVTDDNGNWDPSKEEEVDQEEEKEAAEEQLDANEIYKAAFVYAMGSEYSYTEEYKNNLSSYTYDPAWLSSTQPNVAKMANAGLQDGALARNMYIEAEKRNKEEKERVQREIEEQAERDRKAREEAEKEAEAQTPTPTPTPETTPPEDTTVTPTPTPTPGDGYTNTDPTGGDGFAPVVEETTETTQNVIEETTTEETANTETATETSNLTEEEISNILDQMLEEIENEETVEETTTITK